MALDADTGKLKWYYQFSPHDEFDHDSVQVPVLADLEWPGSAGQKKMRKVMLWANRNGVFYVLDRATGQFLLGKPFAEVNWLSGFDEKGRPIRAPGKVPTVEGTAIYPGSEGATNWYSPSYSPRTGLFYVSTWDGLRVHLLPCAGQVHGGSRLRRWMAQSHVPDGRATESQRKDDEGHGSVRAIDPITGAERGNSR